MIKFYLEGQTAFCVYAERNENPYDWLNQRAFAAEWDRGWSECAERVGDETE